MSSITCTEHSVSPDTHYALHDSKTVLMIRAGAALIGAFVAMMFVFLLQIPNIELVFTEIETVCMALLVFR